MKTRPLLAALVAMTCLVGCSSSSDEDAAPASAPAASNSGAPAANHASSGGPSQRPAFNPNPG